MLSAGTAGAGATRGGTDCVVRRTRQAAARATSRPPARRTASTSSTLRPGRATRACSSSSPTGTAPRISTVSRATTTSSRGAQRSTARPSRALGGPPCWKRASHGPVVCSVARQRSSPSGTKKASTGGTLRAARPGVTGWRGARHHPADPGDADALVPADVDDPVAGPGEVLLDVVATAVNRADVMQRMGFYDPPPGASPYPGLECAGRVAVLGDGVQGWSVGDEVCALLSGGGYATRVAVPAGQLLPVPDGPGPGAGGRPARGRLHRLVQRVLAGRPVGR